MSALEDVILRLSEIGFFQFVLPFLLTSAIFYGLLRKSQIFGDPDKNIAINAVVSLTAGFMVWAYPIIAGVDVTETISTFFFQGAMAMVGVILGIMIAGMFLPKDLPSEISKHIKSSKGIGIIVAIGLIIAFVIVITSGLIGLIIPSFSGISIGGGGVGFVGPGLNSTDLLTIVTIGIMGAVIIAITRGGGGKN